MKKRLLSVFAFALAVSAGAAFVLYELIASKVKAGGAPTPPPTTKVYVSTRDLELGALVQEKDVRQQEYLAPPAGAITKKEDIVGRGVVNPIHEDAPFFEKSLAAHGAGAGFAATIPKGMRAFAVHVNEVVGVAGFAVAGMRVDILVSGSPSGGGSNDSMGTITRTLLQNVEVLSAGQNYQKDAEGKPVMVQVVNLLVTPENAEILNLATDQKIQLVLRNPADQEIVKTPGAASASLFMGGPVRLPTMTTGMQAVKMPSAASPARVRMSEPVQAAKPKAEEPPHKVTIEVFNGSRRTESTFTDPPTGTVQP